MRKSKITPTIAFAFCIFWTSCKDPGPSSNITHDPVIISKVFPEEAYVGDVVVITGEHFGSEASGLQVSFGEVQASVMAISDTSIKVTVPTSANSAKIRVQKNGQTSQSLREFVVLRNAANIIFSNTYHAALWRIEKFFARRYQASSDYPSSKWSLNDSLIQTLSGSYRDTSGFWAEVSDSTIRISASKTLFYSGVYPVQSDEYFVLNASYNSFTGAFGELHFAMGEDHHNTSGLGKPQGSRSTSATCTNLHTRINGDTITIELSGPTTALNLKDARSSGWETLGGSGIHTSEDSSSLIRTLDSSRVMIALIK